MKGLYKFFGGALLVIAIIVDVCYAVECGQEEFARCAEPLDKLHLTSDFQIGKKEQLDELCLELKKGIKCIQSFTRRCFNMDQRNHFNKMYHGTSQFIRDLCNEGSFQDEYLRHASCSELAKDDFETCAKRYKDALVFMNPVQNQENQENLTFANNLKTICCSYQELIECSENVARHKCGNDAAKFVKDLLGRFGTSLVKLHCDAYSKQPELCGHALSGATTTTTRIFISSKTQYTINFLVLLTVITTILQYYIFR